MSRLLLASVLASVAALGGCNGVKCGQGTFKDGENCVGYDPNDKTPPVTTVSPAGGRSREPLPATVTLTTDEPAKIYYTVDGSDPDPAMTPGETSPVTVIGITQGVTIKYLAVDTAGNREQIKTALFESDTRAPAPVGGLAVNITGTSAHVSWTNPTDADYAGTVLARVADLVDTAPAPGQMVTSGTALSPSLQIVSVGKTTTFDDLGLPPGPARYVAWTFDDVGNYSVPVALSGDVALGALTATLTFDTTNTTLAITSMPANFDLTGTSAMYAGSQLTITLKVTNNTKAYLQNPKAEVVSTTNASFSNPNGTADGLPFATLGPNMLAPAAVVMHDLVFTGVTNDTTATINLALAAHSSLIFSYGRSSQEAMLDLGSGNLGPVITAIARGPNDRVNGRTRPGMLVGGHFFDVPTTHGVVERFDLATGLRVGSVLLGQGEKANVQALVPAGGYAIAVLKMNGKRRSGEVQLVQIDEGLHVHARVKIPYNDDQGFSPPGLSVDGSVLALPLSGGVVLVDPRTLQLIDPVPSTPIIDQVSTGLTGRARSVVFFDGSNGMVALGRDTGQASFIKLSPTGYTKTLYQDAAGAVRGYASVLAPDGRIWMAFASGVRAYDPSTGMVSPVAYPNLPQGLGVLNNQMWIVEDNRGTLDQVSNTGAIVTSLGAPQGAYGHTLGFAR